MKLAVEATQLTQAPALRDKKARTIAHLRAADGMLSIATCDGNTTIKTVLPAQIAEPGEVAVSADALGKLVAGFGAADITMTANANVVTIASGAGRYRLPIADAPAVLAINSSASEITISAADLLRLFEPVSAAESDAAMRFYLCGLFLHVADGQFCGVATDGVTLLKTSVAADASFPPTIVPTGAVATMSRLVRMRKPARVTLRRSGTLLEVVAPAFTFATRTIAATYPDYAKILPKTTATAATCSRSALSAALQRLAAAAMASPLVGMTWIPGNPLHLTLLRQPDTGTDAIAAETQGQAQIALALPAFASLVDEFDGDTIRIEVDGERAITIRAGSKFGVLTGCNWHFIREDAALTA